LNNIITQVAPPSDKINNSVFHLENPAIPLHGMNVCVQNKTMLKCVKIMETGSGILKI